MTTDASDLRTIADYQFGVGAGEALFPRSEDAREADDLEADARPAEDQSADRSVTRTSSGRPRQIHVSAGRVATYGTDGRFRLGLEGGRRLHGATDGYTVVVGDESDPYVRDGRNVFAKFVSRAETGIRPRDEVLVAHEDGDLLAVGRAELSGAGMLDFETGVAVSVRESVE